MRRSDKKKISPGKNEERTKEWLALGLSLNEETWLLLPRGWNFQEE